MKQAFFKILMTICMAFIGVLSANAAELQEVVYLKNGSVIRGVILEMTPDKTIKIQTTDGNIFVYQMAEVEKITKEKPFEKKTENNNSYNYNYSYSYSHSQDYKYEPYGWEKSPRYRGFVSLSTVIGLGDYDLFRLMLTTSHGIQLTPEIFIGAGIGLASWVDISDYMDYEDDTYTSVPIFANIRGELHNIFRKNFSPYLDVKVGYSVADIQGVFFTPEAGCHFYFGHKKLGLGFGIGYHLQQTEVTEYWWDYGSKYPMERWSTSRKILNGISLSVAFDF